MTVKKKVIYRVEYRRFHRLSNNIYEILIMISFGVFGIFEYPLATFLLGMVLGSMTETSFRERKASQALILHRG